MEKSNFELFVETVNSLRYSQGFYSRLADDIENMDNSQISDLKEHLNGLDTKFKDAVDVVMFLEC